MPVSTKEVEETFQSYPNLCRFALKDENGYARLGRKFMIEHEEETWKELAEAEQSGDEAKIQTARSRLQVIKAGKMFVLILLGTPSFNLEVNDFFLGTEARSKGMEH